MDKKQGAYDLAGGTPKTLDEAIEHMLCIGPMSNFKEQARAILKDFMAQKFATAYLKAGNDEKTFYAIKDLYVELTKRGLK